MRSFYAAIFGVTFMRCNKKKRDRHNNYTKYFMLYRGMLLRLLLFISLHLQTAPCLRCHQVSERRVGDGELIFFKGTKTQASCTIVLRGANDFMLDEMDR